MISVIILGILSVFFALLASRKNLQFGLKVSFLLIFAFLALRYNYGSDYMTYYKDFFTINSYPSINYFDKSFHYEAGWLFLCRVFSPFGFFSMVIVLAAFNCIVYYWFIKKYVPIKYYWLAVFFYIFTPGFMLVHASAMRQSIAIAIFLISVPYIYKKKPIHYFVLIGIAYLFHTSALILIPIYFIGIFNWKINTKMSIVLFLLFLLLFIYGDLLLAQVNSLLSLYFQQYETYLGTGAEINSGLGVIFLSIMLIFILFYSRFQYKEADILFKLAILGFIFIPAGLQISMISRIGMYFTPVTIAIYPSVVKKIKEPMVKSFFFFFIIFFTLYTFVMFFTTGVFAEGFKSYQTIFSAPLSSSK